MGWRSIATIFTSFLGFNSGTTSFSSFSEWGGDEDEVVGGVRP